jgi:hypothetical protein
MKEKSLFPVNVLLLLVLVNYYNDVIQPCIYLITIFGIFLYSNIGHILQTHDSFSRQ